MSSPGIENAAKSHTARWVLLSVVLLACAFGARLGCKPTNRPPARPGGASAQSDGSELFAVLASNLNNLEQYKSNDEILKHTRDWLNEWLSSQEKLASSPNTPLLSTLPKHLQKGNVSGVVDRRSFDLGDADYLQESIWLRDASRSANRGELEPLRQAERLFDWTVRNIELEDSAEAEKRWLTPSEILLLGRGTAEERAWVFILLARQQRLDAVLLAAGKQQAPWLPAVLIDGRLYLFDTRLALPVRTADGSSIATLADALSDEKVLRQLDGDEKHPYPVSAADLKDVIALIEASPRSLSPRMKMVESRLAGRQRVVLTVAPSALSERLKKAQPAIRAGIWRRPFDVAAQRAKLGEKALAGLADIGILRPDTPLWNARVRHIRGLWDGDDGAKTYYMGVRLSNTQIEEMRAKPEQVLGPLLFEHMDPDARIRLVQEYARLLQTAEDRKAFEGNPGRFIGPFLVHRLSAARRDELLEKALSTFVKSKQYASYWLGLLALEQGDYDSAIDYLGKRTLETSAEGPRRASARYNLARAYEAKGDIQRAIELYRADDSAQRHGNHLRARDLEQRSQATAKSSE